MPLSTGWVIFIMVVVFAIIISSITTLKKSNKAFDFSDDFEKPDTEQRDNNDEIHK